MGSTDVIAEGDIELLLVGDTPADRPDLAPLAELLGSVRSDALAEPPPPMSVELRILIAEAEVARTGAPAAAGFDRVGSAGAALDGAAVEGNVVPLRGADRGRWRTASGAAVAAAVLLTGVGVSAAQDRLPGPVQDAVASVGRIVGIQLPTSGDRVGPPAVTPSGTAPARPGGPGEPTTPAVPGGQREDRPGQDRDGSPSETAPGQSRDGSPSETAPGQSRDGSPSETAPGQDPDGSPSETAPGRVEVPPPPVEQPTGAPAPGGQGTGGQGTGGQGTGGQGTSGQGTGGQGTVGQGTGGQGTGGQGQTGGQGGQGQGGPSGPPSS